MTSVSGMRFLRRVPREVPAQRLRSCDNDNDTPLMIWRRSKVPE